ncbi:MAG TPA: alpha-amylase, partial [Blastococcus sp.]|nr:alpha-amylase [Blastococcus sp.]
AYAFGGIPLLYMGDELALRNDRGYLADPERAPDNRWMHRPPMDWTAAGRRHDPATLEGRVFEGLRRMGEVRRSLVALRGGTGSELLALGSDAVLAWRRRHPRGGTFVGVTNLSPVTQAVDADAVTGFGTFQPVLASDEPLQVYERRLLLPGLSFAWFAEP